MEDLKQVNLLLEYFAKCPYLAKSHQGFYVFLHEYLSKENLAICTNFPFEVLEKLLKLQNANLQNIEHAFSSLLHRIYKDDFLSKTDSIFLNVLKSNFPHNAEKLDKNMLNFENSLSEVEQKMYLLIKTYIELLNRSLELFVFLDEEKTRDFENLSNFTQNVHEKILECVFYEEEIKILHEPLSKLSLVYLAFYYKNFYT